MDSKKILITGATGKLGKEIINECKKQGIEFVGISRRKKDNLKQIDITKKINLKGNFEAVIHLAAQTNSKTNSKKEYNKTNLVRTKNIITFCKNNNIPKLSPSKKLFEEIAKNDNSEYSRKRSQKVLDILYNKKN